MQLAIEFSVKFQMPDIYSISTSPQSFPSEMKHITNTIPQIFAQLNLTPVLPWQGWLQTAVLVMLSVGGEVVLSVLAQTVPLLNTHICFQLHLNEQRLCPHIMNGTERTAGSLLVPFDRQQLLWWSCPNSVSQQLLWKHRLLLNQTLIIWKEKEETELGFLQIALLFKTYVAQLVKPNFLLLTDKQF